MLKRFRRGISWYGTVIIRILPYPLIRIEYKDFEKRLEGPCLFVCNHRSMSDPFLIACLPYEVIQIVNVWPLRIPVLGVYARLAGYLNINKMAVENFFSKALKRLKEGVSIISFPEGTRSSSTTMGQFGSSTFRLALLAKVPLVPVCISGNEHTPQRGSLLLRPGTIKFYKLQAIRYDEYKDLTAFQLKKKVRKLMIGKLACMDGFTDD